MILRYPWVSLDITQIRGSYDLAICLSENVSLTVTLDDKELDALKVMVDSILEHREWLRKANVPSSEDEESKL